MVDFNLPAHQVEKGDPRVDGPYLDDIRADQERAYREARMKNKKDGGGTITLADVQERRDELDREARTNLVTDSIDANAHAQNHHAPVEDRHDQKQIKNRSTSGRGKFNDTVEEPELTLDDSEPEPETEPVATDICGAQNETIPDLVCVAEPHEDDVSHTWGQKSEEVNDANNESE